MCVSVNSPPVEGWQAKLDGVVASYLHLAIPLLWRGGKRSLTGWLPRICTNIVPDHSPPVEGWRRGGVLVSALGNSLPVEGWGRFSTGWLPSYLHLAIPLLWRGGRRMHFVMHTFNNHVEGLHNVTPIVPAQSAVLSDGVVASRLQ